MFDGCKLDELGDTEVKIAEGVVGEDVVQVKV